MTAKLSKRRQKDPKVVPIGIGPPKLASGGGVGLLASADGRLVSWEGADLPEEDDVIAQSGRRVAGVAVGFGVGGATCIAWTMSGKAYAWGDNRCSSDPLRRMGLGDWDMGDCPQPVPLGDTRLVGAACGMGHVGLVGGDGSLLTAGGNSLGQLGHGDFEDRGALAPVAFPVPVHVASVACGNQFTLVVGAGGQIWSFGCNSHGQLGLGDTEPRPAPARVRGCKGAVHAGAGDGFSVCVTEEGAVYTWGKGADGRLGHGDDADLHRPELVTTLERKRVVQVAVPACGEHVLARTLDGAVYSWGCGSGGRLGHGDIASRPLPTEVVALRGRGVVEVGAGGASASGLMGTAVSCARTGPGQLFTWGRGAGHAEGDILEPRVKGVPLPPPGADGGKVAVPRHLLPNRSDSFVSDMSEGTRSASSASTSTAHA